MARILIVDDEPILCASLKRLLSIRWQVATAFSAHEALQVYEEFSPHLLLVDWTLGPGDNGIQLLKNLRSKGKTVPAVIMTGADCSEIQEQVSQLTDTFVLAKPCPYQQLCELIDGILLKASKEGKPVGDQEAPQN